MNHEGTQPFLERYTIGEVRGSIANMDSETQLLRWNLALVTLLAWVVGMAVGLAPDGLALIEFKSALTTISPLLEDWNASDASPCSWGGINCTDSGRVRNISLSAQEPMLEGNISASLGKLEFLEGLMLDQNMLSGSIPPELGNLSRLRMLSLYMNSLTGEIPPELGNCSSLSYLALYNNVLSGEIPEVIYKNLNLTLFDVSVNSLSGDITTGMTSFHSAL
jgi:Leucine-rich repeat (LRR) protein